MLKGAGERNAPPSFFVCCPLRVPALASAYRRGAPPKIRLHCASVPRQLSPVLRFAPVCHNIGVNSEAPRLTLPPLKLGNLTVDTPVVLAPMAGVTNKAFRRLCSEYGGGLYVTEMVTARALVERKPESMRIIEHDPDEKIRSIQIYGVDAVNVGKGRAHGCRRGPC